MPCGGSTCVYSGLSQPVNWFVANQLCLNTSSVLPPANDGQGEQDAMATIQCPDDVIDKTSRYWTVISDATWQWSTGKIKLLHEKTSSNINEIWFQNQASKTNSKNIMLWVRSASASKY